MSAGPTRPQFRTDRLGAIALALLLLVGGGAGWLLLESRRATYDKAVRAAENLLLGLEHDIRRRVESLDFALKAAASGAALPELASLRPEVRRAILFDGSVAADVYGGLLVSDATGRTLYDSVGSIARDIDLSDRSFFRAHRDNPHLGLLVDGPVVSRRTSGWAIVLSRRLDHADGTFAGIVSGTVQLDEFARLFSELDLGEGGTLALITLEGRLLVREPSVPGAIGQDVSGSLAFREVSRVPAASRTVTFEAGPSDLDGISRRAVYRRVANLPLGLLYAVTEEELYSAWTQQALIAGGVLLLLAAAAAALAWGLWRELGRRNALEREARAHSARAALLMDNASDLLLHLDWDSRCRFVSPACGRLLGFAAEALEGRRWLDLVHPDDQMILTSSLLELQLGDPLSPAMYRVRHRDGTWRSMEAHGRSLPDITGAIVALRDITDRLEFEAKLQQSQRMEALGQLTAGVAHDFNNMLQAQMGCLELLHDELQEEDQPPGPGALRLAAQALTLGERGARLTHQLLAFARQQILAPRGIALREFLDGLTETLRRTLGPQYVVTASIASDAPDPFADRAHLESAMLNLALNARDSMPAGGTIEIEARASDTGDTGLVLVVRDAGTGMDARTLERACEPFFTTKGNKGTGLGLASVQGFASQSGGGLTIRSVPGAGTTVTLTLPASTQVEAEQVAAGLRSDCSGRLLLVDDTADVLVIVGAFLRGAGFDVVEALGPELALDALAEHGPFDCLVTDYAMPGTNGGELIHLAQQFCPGLPTLIITGWGDIDDLEQLAEHTTILRKPFKRDELRSSVLGVMANNLSMQQES